MWKEMEFKNSKAVLQATQNNNKFHIILLCRSFFLLFIINTNKQIISFTDKSQHILRCSIEQ